MAPPQVQALPGAVRGYLFDVMLDHQTFYGRFVSDIGVKKGTGGGLTLSNRVMQGGINPLQVRLGFHQTPV